MKKARMEKHVDLEEIEKNLRIRKKFLQALEENAWHKLPSLPYIKGFLKNYSQYLGLKPEEMVAVFRRQFSEQQKGSLLPKGLAEPLNKPFIRFTPQVMFAAVIFCFLLFFFGYLFFQYKTYTSPPNLAINKPLEGEILKSDKILVNGKTDSDAVVSVNNEKIALSENGEFSTTLTLLPGINTITVESVSKYGKKKTLTRTIQINFE